MAHEQARPRVGLVVDGTDHFLRPIERELRTRYDVTRFEPRFVWAPLVGSSINRRLLDVQLRRFLSANDIVFFEWAGSLLVKATHLSTASRIVTRLHSNELTNAAHLVDWARVAKVVLISEQMERRLLKVASPAPECTVVVRCGIELDRFRPVPRNFRHRIGMIARVSPIKRIYEAVLTVYALRLHGHPFTLAVGGPLDDEAEQRYPWAIRELIDRLGLGEYVTLYGPIADPAPFYAEIDIFLSNSYWEGQQNALLEAMASGCYCLSHCWGGAEEVLPPEQIFTTESELQAKLITYAALPPDAQAAAQAQMRAIAEERFDERRMVNEVVGVVDAVLCSDQQG